MHPACADEGHFHSSFTFNASHVRRYVHGARRLVGALRRAFPRARLLWRTLHPGAKHSITPSGAHALNEALRCAGASRIMPARLLSRG